MPLTLKQILAQHKFNIDNDGNIEIIIGNGIVQADITRIVTELSLTDPAEEDPTRAIKISPQKINGYLQDENNRPARNVINYNELKLQKAIHILNNAFFSGLYYQDNGLIPIDKTSFIIALYQTEAPSVGWALNQVFPNGGDKIETYNNAIIFNSSLFDNFQTYFPDIAAQVKNNPKNHIRIALGNLQDNGLNKGFIATFPNFQALTSFITAAHICGVNLNTSNLSPNATSINITNQDYQNLAHACDMDITEQNQATLHHTYVAPRLSGNIAIEQPFSLLENGTIRISLQAGVNKKDFANYLKNELKLTKTSIKRDLNDNSVYLTGDDLIKLATLSHQPPFNNRYSLLTDFCTQLTTSKNLLKQQVASQLKTDLFNNNQSLKDNAYQFVKTMKRSGIDYIQITFPSFSDDNTKYVDSLRHLFDIDRRDKGQRILSLTQADFKKLFPDISFANTVRSIQQLNRPANRNNNVNNQVDNPANRNNNNQPNNQNNRNIILNNNNNNPNNRYAPNQNGNNQNIIFQPAQRAGEPIQPAAEPIIQQRKQSVDSWLANNVNYEGSDWNINGNVNVKKITVYNTVNAADINRRALGSFTYNASTHSAEAKGDNCKPEIYGAMIDALQLQGIIEVSARSTLPNVPVDIDVVAWAFKAALDKGLVPYVASDCRLTQSEIYTKLATLHPGSIDTYNRLKATAMGNDAIPPSHKQSLHLAEQRQRPVQQLPVDEPAQNPPQVLGQNQQQNQNREPDQNRAQNQTRPAQPNFFQPQNQQQNLPNVDYANCKMGDVIGLHGNLTKEKVLRFTQNQCQSMDVANRAIFIFPGNDGHLPTDNNYNAHYQTLKNGENLAGVAGNLYQSVGTLGLPTINYGSQGQSYEQLALPALQALYFAAGNGKLILLPVRAAKQDHNLGVGGISCINMGAQGAQLIPNQELSFLYGVAGFPTADQRGIAIKYAQHLILINEISGRWNGQNATTASRAALLTELETRANSIGPTGIGPQLKQAFIQGLQDQARQLALEQSRAPNLNM